MTLHITDVKHFHDYQLWLKFNDGTEGVVDLTQELWGSVFEPLKTWVYLVKSDWIKSWARLLGRMVQI